MLSRFTLLKQLPAGFLTGLLAGAATGFTRLHPEWAPLQVPALALLGWDLSREKAFWGSLRPGFWFGLALAAVALSKIRVDIASTAILFVALTAYWTLLGAGMSYFLRKKSWLAAGAAAGLLTLGEWSQAYVLPLFGTAQRIAAAWVDSTVMLPFSRLGGTTLVTLVVATTAFLAARLVSFRRIGRGEGRCDIAACVCMAAALFSGWCADRVLAAFHSASNPRTVTVAVCGAKNGTSAFLPPGLFKKKFGALVAEAAAKGATVVVTPELALGVTPGERDATLAALADEAKRLGVTWVVGFGEGGRATPDSLNRAVILNADKPVGDIYDKTHWVSFMESYAKVGDAAAPTAWRKDPPVRVGTMICQDDNFENVARNLSLGGAEIVGVPTWDWPGVAEAHLDSARNRPREFGFVEARAAMGGVSAIIDPSGRILASINHLTEGDGIVVATVTISRSGTLFAHTDDRIALMISGACLFGVLLKGLLQGRKKDPAAL